MVTPLQTPREARTQTTFRALLAALSYPGQIQTLSLASGLQAVAETLLDLETSYYLKGHDAVLSEFLQSTGAQAQPPNLANYHFYPQLDATALPMLKEAQVGHMLQPDESATLVIAAQIGTGTRLRLQGPGIAYTQEVFLEGLPKEFWSIRASQVRYPLGWDAFILDGSKVLGLPRTTQVEVL